MTWHDLNDISTSSVTSLIVTLLSFRVIFFISSTLLSAVDKGSKTVIIFNVFTTLFETFVAFIHFDLNCWLLFLEIISARVSSILKCTEIEIYHSRTFRIYGRHNEHTFHDGVDKDYKYVADLNQTFNFYGVKIFFAILIWKLRTCLFFQCFKILIKPVCNCSGVFLIWRLTKTLLNVVINKETYTMKFHSWGVLHVIVYQNYFKPNYWQLKLTHTLLFFLNKYYVLSDYLLCYC